MSRRRIHFGNENKAKDFARETNGNFNENKGNTEKPFTVSFDKGSSYHEDAHDFDSDINGNGTNWHTSEDL